MKLCKCTLNEGCSNCHVTLSTLCVRYYKPILTLLIGVLLGLLIGVSI